MSHIVISNTGDWDIQSLGVIGTLKSHRDFRSFCDEQEREENGSVPRSLYSDEPDIIDYTVLQKHEMSMYSDGVIVEAITFPDKDGDDYVPNVYLLISI